MMKLNNLVRKLASSETMGGATHICSDKTGTLTQNKMTVMAIQAIQKVYLAKVGDPDRFSNELAQQVSQEMGFAWESLLQGVLYNSSARIERDPEQNNEWVTRGNVTEQGLIKFFMNVINAEGCIQKRNELNDENTLELISFSSSRKRASIIVRNAEKEGTDQEVRVYTKGAPDMLFDRLSGVIDGNGDVQGCDDSVDCPDELLEIGNEQCTTYMGILEKTVKLFAAKAFRTILVTYRDMSMAEFESLKADNNDFEKEADREILEQDLVAVGIFGLQDPLRFGIKDSIEQCRKAGITTIMCTGDNIDTAIAISKNAGILEETTELGEYSCMTGKNFRELVGPIVERKDPKTGKMKDTVKNMHKF